MPFGVDNNTSFSGVRIGDTLVNRAYIGEELVYTRSNIVTITIPNSNWEPINNRLLWTPHAEDYISIGSELTANGMEAFLGLSLIHI